MNAASHDTRNPEGKCRLCLNVRRLETSHFLPAAMYKYLNPGDNRHVIVNKQKYFSTSRQITTHLLCRDCEQRFNRNGEQWVLENGFRGHGCFRLQSKLKNSSPRGRTRSGLVFAGAELPDVDMDRLCYFAASVFWRAAVHRWHGEDRIELGPVYTEQFRRFLIGQDGFPVNAVTAIQVSNAEEPIAAAFFPTGGKAAGSPFHWYSFSIPGLMFWLLVGGGIPAELRAICAVRSPGRRIDLTDNVETFVQATAVEMIVHNTMIRSEVLGSDPAKGLT